MKFEEVLPLMRQGKKATLPFLKSKRRYFTCHYMRIIGDKDENKIITLVQIEKKFNYGRSFISKEGKYSYVEDISPPGVYIAFVMSDEWEIVDET